METGGIVGVRLLHADEMCLHLQLTCSAQHPRLGCCTLLDVLGRGGRQLLM